MSLDNDTRHCRVQTRSKLPATIDEFNEEVAVTLRRAVANDRQPSKRLARIVDRSPRTTEKWMSGEHAPHAFHFLKLAKEIPALKALVRQYLDMESNLDPMTERKLLELQTALSDVLAPPR